MGTAPDAVQCNVMNAWFLHNYRPAAHRIERVYGRLSMRVTIERFTGPGRGQSRPGRYWAHDGCARVNARHEPYLDRELTLIADHDVGTAIWQQLPVHRHRPSRVKCASRESVLQQIRLVMPIAFAPWYWCQQRVEDLFVNDAAMVTGITVTTDPEAGRVCNVSWKYSDRGFFRPGGTFCFAMDRSWPLLSVSHHLNNSTCLAARFTYDDEEIAGVPVIRSAEYWCESTGGLSLHRRMTRDSYAVMSSPSDIFDPCRLQIASALSCPPPSAQGRWGAIVAGLLGLGAVAVALQAWRHVYRPNACLGDERIRTQRVLSPGRAPIDRQRVAFVKEGEHLRA
ncbi:MAG: hypothetical protein ACF8TS_12350 [Maioricimonas sp. JB049]